MEDEEGKKRGGKRRAERVGGGRRGDYCIALKTQVYIFGNSQIMHHLLK